MPDRVARSKVLKELINDHAFAPHVTKIGATATSGGMVIRYNNVVAARSHQYQTCNMGAARGNLIDQYNVHEDLDREITDPKASINILR
ncbi:hypothetical protein MMC28_003529 [Mycoblastus sanguinarius]|nr:hypothetical protein [Mycoblastus sanguinarius]